MKKQSCNDLLLKCFVLSLVLIPLLLSIGAFVLAGFVPMVWRVILVLAGAVWFLMSFFFAIKLWG